MEHDEFQDEELITVKEAASILCLCTKTIYNRKGGTEKLTRVRQGETVRLIRKEVFEHRHNLIEIGKKVTEMIGYE